MFYRNYFYAYKSTHGWVYVRSISFQFYSMAIKSDNLSNILFLILNDQVVSHFILLNRIKMQTKVIEVLTTHKNI